MNSFLYSQKNHNLNIDSINNVNSQYTALNGFIFGGSASIGVMKAGFFLDGVLEMTDNMDELNAYHFVKNSSVPIIKPSDWENDDFLNKLSDVNYDFSFFNCPCSSLSPINRNASVDGVNNIHFYRIFNVVEKVKPKIFAIENASTLISLGFPIIVNMVEKLKHLYNFTIVRDRAGNHDVPMLRTRTLIIGWRKDYFNNGWPDVDFIGNVSDQQLNIKSTIGDLYNVKLGSLLNHEEMMDPNYNYWLPFKNLFHLIKNHDNVLRTFARNYDSIKNELIKQPKVFKEITRRRDKILNGKFGWDKSPRRLDEERMFPSLTSLSLLIHPQHDRLLTVREYARIMGYPENFEFYTGGKTPMIQCMAQGVPVNFVKHIATLALTGLTCNKNKDVANDTILRFENVITKKFKEYNFENLKKSTSFVK